MSFARCAPQYAALRMHVLPMAGMHVRMVLAPTLHFRIIPMLVTTMLRVVDRLVPALSEELPAKMQQILCLSFGFWI